jgi:hypothetical protein
MMAIRQGLLQLDIPVRQDSDNLVIFIKYRQMLDSFFGHGTLCQPD